MNAPPRQDKFRAYRARKKAAGLREIRLWVPDVRRPDYQAELQRHIAEINASDSSGEALVYSDANAAEAWQEPE